MNNSLKKLIDNIPPVFGIVVVVAAIFISLPARAQQPEIFDVSDVVAGAKRIETRYLYALGKWSDAGDEVSIRSTEIHCYQRFGFCEVASAYPVFKLATVSLDSFDILRWDGSELIAVDSSPICVVNTLRVDFASKKISISGTSKGQTKDLICRTTDPYSGKTAFLIGQKEELERLDHAAKERKK